MIDNSQVVPTLTAYVNFLGPFLYRQARHLRRPQWYRLDVRCRLWVDSAADQRVSRFEDSFLLTRAADFNPTTLDSRLTATSTFLVTGSADNQLRLWRVSTGECLKVWEIPTAIKRVQFSEDDTRVLAVTEQRMGFTGTIRIFDISSENEGREQADEPSVIIECTKSKATVAGWTALDKYIVSAHEDGSICQWNPKSGELENDIERVHEGTVMDLQMSADGTYFVTASRDKTAKVGRDLEQRACLRCLERLSC